MCQAASSSKESAKKAAAVSKTDVCSARGTSWPVVWKKPALAQVERTWESILSAAGQLGSARNEAMSMVGTRDSAATVLAGAVVAFLPIDDSERCGRARVSSCRAVLSRETVFSAKGRKYP